MSITSHLFLLVFLPAVCVTWRLANRHSSCAARLCLLAAGILFCGWSAPWSLLVLAGEGTATYCLGRAISRPGSRKKPLLATGVVLVVAVLFLFKYTGFFLAPWTDGLPAWLAPLGLSFGSFQQLFYLRDCYHGEAGEVSPLDYACCLTLFATATCGPITRVGELVPQLRRPEPFSWDGLAAGLYCFALGLFKKVLLAAIFTGGADYGFGLAGSLSPADSAVTILCYTLQIYFDFSGYCDMAWGMGRMMGLDLPVNFDSPYRAVSIQDFWGRWNITLSRFFRSCVYIPLGGNRRGMAVTCRNIMVIFLLSGLWHGAGWGFVIWGALHGVAMVVQRLWGKRKFLPRPLCWLLTFLFVNFAWVFFRAATLDQALALLGDLAGSWAMPSAEMAAALLLPEFEALGYFVSAFSASLGQALTYWLPLLALPGALLLLACPNPTRQAQRFRPAWWKALLAAAALIWSLVSLVGVETFIYANF